MAQKYAIGAIGGLTVGQLAPSLSTSSLVWNGSPVPAPPTPLPASVPQTFSINDVALLQYFGGTENGDCVIDNTSTNSLMVAGGTTSANGNATFVGGTGSNELLGGAGKSQLIGRGTIDYLFANYTVSYTGVALEATATSLRPPRPTAITSMAGRQRKYSVLCRGPRRSSTPTGPRPSCPRARDSA